MAASNVESKTLPTASTIMIGAAIGVAALFAARAIVRARRRLELRGRKVVIIGGSRGLGLALAREFAERRARLVLCARDKQELEAAAADLAARGGNAAIFVCDGKDRDQVAATIAAIENDGPIDVLVNCAGTIIVGPLESMTLEDFRHTMDVNFWSAMHATFAALPGMRARRQGRIVNIGSVGGRLPAPHLAAYCASKYALVGMSEALGVELRNDGIFVTTVNPGLMRTGSPRNARFKGNTPAEYAWFSIADSLPGLSISAQSAARRIVKAAIYGEAEVSLGLPAWIGSRFHAFSPSLHAELAAMANRLFPTSNDGHVSQPGYANETRLTQSFLRALGKRAERDLNQLRSPFLAAE